MTETFEITIRNFQSLSRASLTCAPGLTVIVGSNNVGKTAIFRAVYAALFNEGTDDQVRQGESGAAVQISYRGHSIIWRRLAKASGSQSKYACVGLCCGLKAPHWPVP